MRPARRFVAEGRVVICPAAKTGRQILQRHDPTQPLEPGKPAKREHTAIRHGGRAVLAPFVVPTGHVLWILDETRPSSRLVLPIWPQWSRHGPPGSARTGWGIPSTPTGAARAALWSRTGATGLVWPRTCNAGDRGGGCGASHTSSRSATFPPNMGHGFPQLRCG